MPDEFDYTGPDLIGSSELPSSAGTDYEYEDGYYLETLKAQLAAMQNQFEKQQEEDKKEGLFGTDNMDKLNTMLTIRSGIETFRDAYVNKKITRQGGFHTMEDPNRPGSGKTMDNSAASWKFQDGNVFNNAAEVGLGWTRGIESVNGENLASTNEDKIETTSGNSGENSFNPDKRILSYATNPTTGEMDSYYTDKDGTVHWSNNTNSTSSLNTNLDENNNIVSTEKEEDIELNGTLVDGTNNASLAVDNEEESELFTESSISTNESESVVNTKEPKESLSAAEKRAQDYINKDFRPDDTIDKEAYLALGGKHTPKGGWGKTEDNVADLNKEIKDDKFDMSKYKYEFDDKLKNTGFATIEADNTRVENKFVPNEEKLYNTRLDIAKLDNGGFELNYGATDSLTFDSEKALNSFIAGRGLTNFSTQF